MSGKKLCNLAQRFVALARPIRAERGRSQSHERAQTLQSFPAFVYAFGLNFRSGEFLQSQIELLARDTPKSLLNRLVDLEPVRHEREAP